MPSSANLHPGVSRIDTNAAAAPRFEIEAVSVISKQTFATCFPWHLGWLEVHESMDRTSAVGHVMQRSRRAAAKGRTGPPAPRKGEAERSVPARRTPGYCARAG
ncbi:MAG: hypothetical protein NFCOHLIN_01398 [Gammaproteobacteria bacterium]|nr:hypothetical protein [Gammaproteobacteria bacterium]